jgi:putative flippase GtrA
VTVQADLWWRLPLRARFLAAGAFNTAFGYLAFSLLYLALRTRLHYLEIGVMSQAIALTSAFIVYRRLVYRSTDRWQQSFVRFNLSQALTFGLGLAGLYGLVHFGHFSPLVAQAVVIATSVGVSYLLHTHFSFRA